MPDGGSVISRRQLAAELRRLRTAAGLTLEQLHQELLISTSKLSRLETAQGLPQLRDVRDLIRFHRLENSPLAMDMERWVREARSTPWWQKMGTAVPGPTAEYLAFESAAIEIHAYASRFVPALLQTSAYAHAHIRAVYRPDSVNVDEFVAVRLARQDIVRRAVQPTVVDLVMDGSALWRQAGDAATMSEQLTYLADIRQTLPNVTIRILPLDVGPVWAAYGGSFSVFKFPRDTHPDVANPEEIDKYLDDPDRVADYLDRYDSLCDAAADPDESSAICADAARHYHELFATEQDRS